MVEHHRKKQVGVVLATKMKKTAIVEVTRLVQHPVYGKVVKQIKKYPVHDEKQSAKVGDKVRIEETRPLSKTKRWRLAEILTSSK